MSAEVIFQITGKIIITLKDKFSGNSFRYNPLKPIIYKIYDIITRSEIVII